MSAPAASHEPDFGRDLTLVGTSRCDVPAREAAGGIIAPLSAARTAQRAVPTRFRVQSAKISWNSTHEPGRLRVADPRSGPRLCEAERFMVSMRDSSIVEAFHEPPLSRPSATLSPPCGERAGRGVPIWFMAPIHVRMLEVFPSHEPPCETRSRQTSSPPPPGRAEIITAAQPDAARAALVRGLLVAFLVENHGVFVVKILQLHALDSLRDEALDRLHVPRVLRHHQRERVAAGLGTAGPANPMHVILRVLRRVEVDDVADVGDVQSA